MDAIVDGYDLSDPVQLRQLCREHSRQLDREERKRETIPDLTSQGVELTAGERNELEPLAAKHGFDLKEIIESFEDRFIVVGERHGSVLLNSLVNRRVIPRNELLAALKTIINFRASYRAYCRKS